MRCVGQEVPKQAYSDLSSTSGSSKYPAHVTNLLNVNGTAAASAPVSATNTARKLITVVDGAQTPKVLQPALDMWIPLLFWFNKDPKLSVPSVSIPLTVHRGKQYTENSMLVRHIYISHLMCLARLGELRETLDVACVITQVV
jgi:hypothetical protein